MKRLLIADKSEELAAAVCQQLAGLFEIHTCHQGADALEALEALRPEVLLIDLTLPDQGGLWVLNRTEYVPPVCIARTTFVSDQVLLAAEAAGVKHVFLVPCRVAVMTACIAQYR